MMRVLTYHYIRNNGAVLFAESLLRLLREAGLPVELLNYQAPSMFGVETLKRLRIRWPDPLFYARRDRTFRAYIARKIPETGCPPIRSRAGLRRSVPAGASVLAAMDVWNINQDWINGHFPSAYWLGDFTEQRRFAFGVSAYRFGPECGEQFLPEVSALVREFEMIAARDAYTYQLMERAGYRGVLVEVPDPTFMLPASELGRSEICRQACLPADRPLIGVAVSRPYRGLKALLADARQAGYLTVGLGMHCRFADVQRGDSLDPMQWFNLIEQCEVLITDRFHGTVAAMIHRTPVLCLESVPLPWTQSKICSVLDRFDLGICHQGETLPAGTFESVTAAIRERFSGNQGDHEARLCVCRCELQDAARQMAAR